MSHRRTRRATVALVTAGLALATTAAATDTRAGAATASPLVLRVPSTMTGTVYTYDGESYTDVQSATYLQAVGQNFELWSHRTSDYAGAVTTTLKRGGTSTELPKGTTDTLAGLSHFLDVSVRDAKGKLVYRSSPTVCLNDYAPSKTSPDAAPYSKYPSICGDNPFALGSVQGIARGWANSVYPFTFDRGESLPFGVGTYKVEVAITAKYRSLFGISSADGRGSSTLTIAKETDEAEPSPGPAARQRIAARTAAEPKTRSPQGVKLAATPKTGPRPDLAALPAWGIEIADDGKYLNFAATVWNAGTSPLVVDGFRKGSQDVMDAYQYFYDSAGKQTGYVRAGSMEWDPRPSHNHWHFSDFARYSLLDASKKSVVVSEKEAFCLANTDAIDYTIKAANWRPENTDLSTACGDHSSIAVSEVLATGSGDTYTQDRAGQSFPLAKLKNGTYYVKTEANPDNVLTELSKTNNVALRKITIGGTTGHRTVYTYPVGDVTD